MGSVFVKQWNIFVPQQVTSCILLPSAQSLNAAKVNLMMNYGRRVLVQSFMAMANLTPLHPLPSTQLFNSAMLALLQHLNVHVISWLLFTVRIMALLPPSTATLTPVARHKPMMMVELTALLATFIAHVLSWRIRSMRVFVRMRRCRAS
jgi:hypothetical protein